MFLYTTSSKFRFPLAVYNLSDNPQWLNQAAKWAEEKWGYLRNFPGVEKRKELIEKMQNSFYIVTYAEQAIGMFALIDLSLLDDQIRAKELMYFYVDANFRGMGVGSRVLKIAKDIATQLGRSMIVFDTLNTNLNRFYEKHGAKIVCENHLLGHATTIFKM